MARVALRTGTPSLRLLAEVFLMTPVTTGEIGESRARFGARAKFAPSTDRGAITILLPCCLRYAVDGLSWYLYNRRRS